jgi:hypothetical protein
MMMTCSTLHKRGVQVKAFNLEPYQYDKLKNKQFLYRERLIPIVSEGWIDCDNVYYRILDTPEGTMMIINGYAVI